MINKKNFKHIDLESVTLRLEATNRGGGIEIALDEFGFPSQKMTAYQNYLGGGMLGSIQNDCTIKTWRASSDLLTIADRLAKYFHSLTNHDYCEYENATFEENQNRPTSAY
jgi:hypothetical protein